MLAISIRVRQFIGKQTDPYQIKLKLRSSVLSVALAVVLAVLVALVALIALIVSVALIVFVIAAVIAAAVVATLNISRSLTKTMITKVPAVVAGTFLYKVKHMKQVMVHRIIVFVIILI
jgi:hypothetical protein